MKITKVVSGQWSVPRLHDQSVSGLWSVYNRFCYCGQGQWSEVRETDRTALSELVKTKTRLDPFFNNLLLRNDTVQLRVKSVEVG